MSSGLPLRRTSPLASSAETARDTVDLCMTPCAAMSRAVRTPYSPSVATMRQPGMVRPKRSS
jgi:hypothetical protein